MSVVLFHILLLFCLCFMPKHFYIQDEDRNQTAHWMLFVYYPQDIRYTLSRLVHTSVCAPPPTNKGQCESTEKWTLTFTIIVMVFNERRTSKQIQIITRCTASSFRSKVCHRRFICACVVWEFEADDIRLVFRGHTWTWNMPTDNGWRLSSTSSLCIWLTHSFPSSLRPSGTFLIIHHTRINQHSWKVNCWVRLSGNLPIPAAVSTVLQACWTVHVVRFLWTSRSVARCLCISITDL